MKHNIHKKIIGGVIAGGILIAVLIFLVNSHQPTPKNAITISSQDSQKAQEQYTYFSTWLKTHEPQGKTYDEQKELLDETIISSYAKAHSIILGPDELEASYQKAVASVGTESEYLAKMKAIRGFDKNTILEKLTIDLLKSKIEKLVGMPIGVWLSQQEAQVTIVQQ